MTAPTLAFTADLGDDGHRLDQTLVRRITAVSRFSRNVAQQWIAQGAVTVGGRVARRPSMRVTAGTAIGVELPASARLKAAPAAEAGPLRVLHEDEHLIVIDKPAGMVVHPSYKQTSGTLLNLVLWRLRDRPGVRPGIVTRLDRQTSGLVLVATGPSVHAALQRALAGERARKEYLALVRGWPRATLGRILHLIGRDPGDRRRMVVTPDGLASETRYEEMSRHQSVHGPEALLRCELITGRTHQIRVHLAAEGWPIVGDTTYGEADSRIARQALHAWRLHFTHPLTGQAVDVEAPVPAEMAALLP